MYIRVDQVNKERFLQGLNGPRTQAFPFCDKNWEGLVDLVM